MDITKTIDSIVLTKQYFLFLVCIIMPINGILITQNFILGMLLVLTQVPYLWARANNIEWEKINGNDQNIYE